MRMHDKTPSGFPPGVELHLASTDLPVALSAEEHGDRVLILQLVGCGRLGTSGRGRGDETGILPPATVDS